MFDFDLISGNVAEYLGERYLLIKTVSSGYLAVKEGAQYPAVIVLLPDSKNGLKFISKTEEKT